MPSFPIKGKGGHGRCSDTAISSSVGERKLMTHFVVKVFFFFGCSFAALGLAVANHLSIEAHASLIIFDGNALIDAVISFCIIWSEGYR